VACWTRGSTRRRAATWFIPLLVAMLGVTAVAFGATDRPATPLTPTALPAVVAAVEAVRHGAPIPSRLEPPIARIRVVPRRFRIPNPCIAHDSSPRTTSKVCRVGRVGSRRLLVLIGDSHAFMWLPSVLTMARQDGWAVVPLLRLGCTPGKWITQEGPDACRAWYRWALDRIRRLHPQVTLLGGSIGEEPSPYARAATEGVIQTARTLKALGRVVVIGDPEGLATDPVACLRARNASMARCSTTWPAASLEAYDTVAKATKQLGIGFLATRGFVCFERVCPPVVGHTIVWVDNNHLTGLYAAAVAGAFRLGFVRALQ